MFGYSVGTWVEQTESTEYSCIDSELFKARFEFVVNDRMRNGRSFCYDKSKNYK